jgi:hypothetical protein
VIARIIACYGSKVQPRTPLARLAALMLIAAVAPPMASAMTRDVVEADNPAVLNGKADDILRELLGSAYQNYALDDKKRLRECTSDKMCLMQLQYHAQLSKAH